MASQFPKLRNVAWDGSVLALQASSGHVIALTLTTGAEAAPVYLHFYDVATAGEVASATPFWTELLPPSYTTVLEYGAWQEFDNGLALKVTNAASGSGSLPVNALQICARYR